MAAIRMAYLGGGSTRAVGTVASFIHQGDDFAGSEIVLIDLPGSRLDLVKTLADKMAKARGLDMTFTTTTDRRAGLAGVVGFEKWIGGEFLLDVFRQLNRRQLQQFDRLLELGRDDEALALPQV